MPVHKASARDELMRAATALQPSVGGGQVTFLLAGQVTAAALAASWERCLTYPGDTVLLAETSGQLVGACGLLVSDETHTQTINGPVVRPRSADDEDGVVDALLTAARRLHPDAAPTVGVSHRHAPVLHLPG